ncbi:MAG: T9SS type A sorting domain-containing protein [Bacteroidetes bacterium]|nr:T9SS type A sorting domain-containing protein [Bacteroidota bacterium]
MKKNYSSRKIFFIAVIFLISLRVGAQCTFSVTMNSTGVTSCAGNCDGSASVTVSGGTAPYTYAWFPGSPTTPYDAGMCAGTYTCYVTDAVGCMGSETVSITQPPNSINATASHTDVVCNGTCTGTAQVNVSSTYPVTYNWMPGNITAASANSLCIGNYSCTILDTAGCSVTRTVSITEPTPLLLNLTSVDESASAACDGSANANASGGNALYSFFWSPIGSTLQNVTNLCAGTYTCCVTDFSGCTTCTTVIVGTMNGINTNAGEMSVNIFPDPANENIQISISLSSVSDVHIEIFDVLGEKVDAIDLGNAGSANYNSSALVDGIYFFRISSGKEVITKRLIVSH